MTFKDYARNQLTDNGMFEKHASEVILNAQMDPNFLPSSISMHRRWEDDIDSYPVVIKHLFWHALKRKALEFIDANIPQAWFRPMFTQDPERTLRDMQVELDRTQK